MRHACSQHPPFASPVGELGALSQAVEEGVCSALGVFCR